MEAHKLITHENVQTALQKDKGTKARLTSFDIKDFTSKGDGYTSFVTSVQVKYSLDDKDCTTSYVLKLNPCRSEEMNKVLEILFEKEIYFFSVLLPKLNERLQDVKQEPLRVPKMFHSSNEFGKEFIFLEDMRLKNYSKMVDDKQGLDAVHVELVLKELARLHSASSLLEEFDKIENLKIKYKHLENIYTKGTYPALHEAYEPIFVTCVDTTGTILANFEKYKKIAKILKDAAPNSFEVMSNVGNDAPSCFHTLCHGDCWNNNLLFRFVDFQVYYFYIDILSYLIKLSTIYITPSILIDNYIFIYFHRYDESGKPVEVCILDHQSENVTSLGVDLNYFFYTSLFPPVRRPNLKSFLSCYYTTCENIMKQAGLTMKFTEEELGKEIRRSSMMGLMSLAMAAPLMLTNKDDTIDQTDMNKDNSEAKMKEFNEKVLAEASNDSLLKLKLLDSCDEFLELL